MEATPTSSMDMIQFAVIVLMALERIIKGFTASPCRHVVCKSCCTSFELEMASPRARSASETARDEKEIDEAKKAHFAWNIRESEPDLITWATWAGPASAQTHLLVVAWPDFRFSEESLRKIKKIIREESAKIGPFALFQDTKK